VVALEMNFAQPSTTRDERKRTATPGMERNKNEQTN